MKIYRKIDLFHNGDYICSTNQSKTCREAKARYLERANDHESRTTIVQKHIAKYPKGLKARFA